jgi:hypothetical protein
MVNEKKNKRTIVSIDLIFRLFNGQEITPSGKYKIESKGNTTKLTIPKVDLVDTGVYEVVVSNGIDTIQSQSKLDVCIKPKIEGKINYFSISLNYSLVR